MSLISPAAQAWLENTSSARVLHVFERACNLINDDREILSLVTSELGAGPFAAVVEAPDGSEIGFTALLEAGQRLHITLGPINIDTRHASLWNPRPAWQQLHSRAGRLAAQLPLLETLLKAHAPPGSFAPLLDCPTATDSQSSASFEARFLEAARQPAQTLRDGILTADLEACREGASRLAGLGSGLTPSGDDFMMGVLYTLWATRAPEEIASFAQAILESAVPRTVPLSAAWLRAAARGEAGQLWHALVTVLINGDDHALTAAARSIISTGHTSGADALAGFLTLLS